MEKDKTRCFIALDLSREAISYVKEIQSLIRKQTLFAGKFTEPENLHLTLKFLGEIEETKIKNVKERLKKIKLKEFEAELEDVGVFSKNFIKLIWIKLNGKEVFDLQKEIDEKLKDIFEPEKRFMSHVTIARVKRIGRNKNKLLDYMGGMKTKKIKFKVNKFYLKKSELRAEGPIYEDLSEYDLIP